MPGFAAFRIGIETPDRNSSNGADRLQESASPVAPDGSTHTAAGDSISSENGRNPFATDSTVESEAEETDGGSAEDDELENSE